GLPAMEAAGAATRQIALAVAGTTLSLLVLFVPVAFMGGRVGRFFSSFGVVVGFSVLASMGISFTMTPMLCSRFLKLEGKRRSSKAGFIWRSIESAYDRVLAWSLDHRWAIVTLAFLTFASTPLLLGWVGKDFIPRDDQSEMGVVFTLPEGYSLERADRVAGEMEARLQKPGGVAQTRAPLG